MKPSRALWTAVCLMATLALLLSACASAPTPALTIAPTELPVPPSQTPVPPTLTPIPPSPQPTEIPPTVTPSGPPLLPPDPQVIDFTASDGQALKGTYYPAAANPAPVIVLMHWAGGDETDWDAIAVWLQNRAVPSRTSPAAYPWQDGSWFPPVPVDFSIAVFTFSFRGCLSNQGCQAFDIPGWLLDAQAGILTAAKLEGVDPARLIVAGASIGADGASDGCFLVNNVMPGACKGALSFSPGDYLNLAYSKAVKELQQPADGSPAVPVWCLADEKEIGVCQAASNPAYTAYKTFEFPGAGHAMTMLSPKVTPSAMQTLLDFIQLAIGTK